MSIITTVVQVNDKNTRTVNTQKGEKQVISTPIIKDSTGKWVYASAFINFRVENGDILTISGRIEQKEDGQYLNNNFAFPTVERLYKPKGTGTNSQPSKDIPEIGDEIEINDDDLPF
ncbi:single-stranded DNA-binding protein [Lactococcus taiwanensis]|uniref:single-stranded DNA-binding protein n=1 Tax=Lactococcus taiwanensis TaxID=1151742 RepID=UPI002896801D|nr:single-stranded DNA-binding protein [Lactococcus taiwanensis]